MKKVLYIILFSILISSVSAEILNEKTFSSLGFESLVTESQTCIEWQFRESHDLNYAIYPVLSVHAKFYPIVSNEAMVRVLLNGELIGDYTANEFLGERMRVDLPWENITGINTIKICPKPSNVTTKIEILNDSTLSYLLKPDFSKDDSFQESLIGAAPLLLEETTVRVVLRNYGSKDAEINLLWRKDSLEGETPEIALVKGDVELDTVIPKCAERNGGSKCIVPGEGRFDYVIKPLRIGEMRLLPAVATFYNDFNEEISLETNRPEFTVKEPEIKIEAFFTNKSGVLKAGEETEIGVSIKNTGKNTLNNIDIYVNGGKINSNNVEINNAELIMIFGENKFHIDSIAPDSVKSFRFKMTGETPGIYSMVCNVIYEDYDSVETDCAPFTIEFQGDEINPAIIGGGALLILALVVFVYIWTRKG
ncbi:MAG: hypothetical protein ABID38_05040 [Candidatus Diapherotrites archaeon]